MKKLISILLCAIVQFGTVRAQAPQSTPFQGIAKNAAGNAIASHVISLRLSIRLNAPNGVIVYQERQTPTTSAQGLFNVSIGEGTILSGTFSSINWGTSTKFLQVEMDTTGGVSYVNMGTRQIFSNAYALYSENAKQWTNNSTSILNTNTGGVGVAGLPNSSAVLDLNSTTKGFRMPRMNTNQRNAISSPATGLQILNSEDQCIDVFEGTNWEKDCGYKLTGVSVNPVHTTDSWVRLHDIQQNISSGVVCAIGLKAIYGGGADINPVIGSQRFWKYDLTTGAYSNIADITIGKLAAFSFSIDSLAYVGTGYDLFNVGLNDFWVYSPTLNTWTQKANFPIPTWNAYAFSIGGKGYAGGGDSNGNFYEYNPVSNSWTLKASYPELMSRGVAFTIAGKGYVGTGYWASSYKNTFREYDPVTNIWTSKANFPGSARIDAVGFALGNYGYIATGYDGADKNDVWRFDPSSNSWTQKSNFTGGARSRAVAFAIGNRAFILSGDPFYSDMWEYMDDVTTGGFSYTSNILSSSGNTINDGVWTLAGNATYTTNSGNVGVGTSNPQSKLHVGGEFSWGGSGSAYLYSNTRAIPFIDASGTNATNSILKIQSSVNGDATNYSKIIIDPSNGISLGSNGTANGNVGIGTQTPNSSLTVSGGIGSNISIQSGSANVTLDNTAYEWYFTGTASIILPPANTCTGRRYNIVNISGLSRTISNYVRITGLSSASINPITAIEIISDGSQWLQIL